MADEWPRIPDFYSGRSVFVTGFSGYMGKLLVQKLLCSCPDIKTIYVILRGKRNLTYQQRFQKIINSDVFDRIREKNEDRLEKIQVLDGDIVLDDLGLTQQQRSLLSDEVTIVFHGAATVKFDDPLPHALDVNVKGTRNVVNMALLMPNLVAFVHISTAYSNCDNFVVEEKIYPPRADWRKTLEIREKLDHCHLQLLAPKYMNHMLNTYVFTKSLGEQMVSEYSDRLPLIIFRPSIVVPAWEEPYPGWLDNLNGPAGLSLGGSAGVVRCMLVNTDVQPDFMPVDLAIRGLALMPFLRYFKREEGVQMYNWCAQERSISYSDLLQKYAFRVFTEAPCKYVLWKPTMSTTTSHLWFYVNFYLFQLLPAFFLDLALRLVGQKPMLCKLQRKVFVSINALSYFTLNYFHFLNFNALQAHELIPKKDFDEFSYLRQPDNEAIFQYLKSCTIRSQSKFLKMKPEDLPTAIKLSSIVNLVDLTVKTIFWAWIVYTVYSFSLIPRALNSTLQFLVPHY